MHREGIPELHSFKESLVKEHEQKIESLRNATGKRIAEMLSRKRIDVEQEIAALNRNHEARQASLLASSLLRVRSRYRSEFLKEANRLFSSVEKMFFEEIQHIKIDTKKYGDILCSLIAEGVEAMGKDAIVYVDSGDSVYLVDRNVSHDVREKCLPRWGGCVIESPDGARVFDNTLKTRWERMYPDVIKALSREVRRIVAEYPEFVSELRLS